MQIVLIYNTLGVAIRYYQGHNQLRLPFGSTNPPIYCLMATCLYWIWIFSMLGTITSRCVEAKKILAGPPISVTSRNM